jgi:hypothetical protein
MCINTVWGFDSWLWRRNGSIAAYGGNPGFQGGCGGIVFWFWWRTTLRNQVHDDVASPFHEQITPNLGFLWLASILDRVPAWQVFSTDSQRPIFRWISSLLFTLKRSMKLWFPRSSPNAVLQNALFDESFMFSLNGATMQKELSVDSYTRKCLLNDCWIDASDMPYLQSLLFGDSIVVGQSQSFLSRVLENTDFERLFLDCSKLETLWIPSFEALDCLLLKKSVSIQCR